VSWAAALLLAGAAHAQTALPAKGALENAPSGLDQTFDGKPATPPAAIDEGTPVQPPTQKPKVAIPEAQWGLGGAKQNCPKPPPPKKDPLWLSLTGVASIALGAGLGAWLFGPWGAVVGALLVPLVVGLVIGIFKTVGWIH
jgi:hypothetical protein